MESTLMVSSAEIVQQFLTEFKNHQLPAIRQQAEDGDAVAQRQLGLLYANGRGVAFDGEEAKQWLSRAAEQADLAAMVLLAWLLVQEQSPAGVTQAMAWYQQAAEAGDADAQCALADLYISGAAGIEPNGEAMLYWYDRAAAQHHPKAQYQLGKLLAEGKILPQNDGLAFHWLTFAILNGSAAAQKEMAMLTARLERSQLEAFKQQMLQQYQSLTVH